MKKVFISVPMRNRTPIAIQDTRDTLFRIAKAVWGDDIEAIDNTTYEVPDGVKNDRVYCLGHAIKKMSEADYFIGFGTYWESYPGVVIETEVARYYDIPEFLIDYETAVTMWPDILQAERSLNRMSVDDLT